MEGEAFYVDCLAYGSPKPKDVQWVRKADNGNARRHIYLYTHVAEKIFTPHMPKNVKFTVSSENLVNGRLYVNHVMQDDRAEYECTAKNEYGTSNPGHVMIRVKGVYRTSAEGYRVLQTSSLRCGRSWQYWPKCSY